MEKCKTCKWWLQIKSTDVGSNVMRDPLRYCQNEKVNVLNPQPDFGCVHHESKDKEDANKD